MSIKFVLVHKCPTCVGRTTDVPVEISDAEAEKLLGPYLAEIKRRTASGPIPLMGSPIQCDLCKVQQKTLGLIEFFHSVHNPTIPPGVVNEVMRLWADQGKKPPKAEKKEEVKPT